MGAFFKTVAVGTLAGAWLPMIFTVVVAVSLIPDSIDGHGSVASSLLFAVFPIGVTLAFVLPASVLLGLPVTVILVRLRAESEAAYILIGLAIGAALPLLVLAWMGASEGWWLTLLGAFSGSITGRTWWVEAREASGS
jgi:hypothetical protein